MAGRKASLRVVEDGERSSEPLTILEAAVAGDRLAELRAMRRRLAQALDDPNCPPRDMAALSRRQLEIGREIDAIGARDEQEAGHGVVEDGKFDARAI